MKKVKEVYFYFMLTLTSKINSYIVKWDKWRTFFSAGCTINQINITVRPSAIIKLQKAVI